MFFTYVLFAVMILVGAVILYIGILELYNRFVRKKSYTTSIGLGIAFTLLGLLFIIVGIWACFETPRVEARRIDFTQRCEDKGGIVLELEDVSGWECWQHRIEIEGY